MNTLPMRKTSLVRAVYSMRFAKDLVVDVILKDYSWRVVLKKQLPYGFLEGLKRRILDVSGVMITGEEPYAGYDSLYGHFDY